MSESKNGPKIILVEDDPDQMDLLVQCALDEINKIIENVNTSESDKQRLNSIKIVKVSNIRSLERAISKYKDLFFAVLDCNLPDVKGGKPNDQLVKVKHRITGQHRAVDIVHKHVPTAPITLISSRYRFKSVVYQYYEDMDGLNITFISKDNQEMIQRNIGYHLRQFMRESS